MQEWAWMEITQGGVEEEEEEEEDEGEEEEEGEEVGKMRVTV